MSQAEPSNKGLHKDHIQTNEKMDLMHYYEDINYDNTIVAMSQTQASGIGLSLGSIDDHNKNKETIYSNAYEDINDDKMIASMSQLETLKGQTQNAGYDDTIDTPHYEDVDDVDNVAIPVSQSGTYVSNELIKKGIKEEPKYTNIMYTNSCVDIHDMNLTAPMSQMEAAGTDVSNELMEDQIKSAADAAKICANPCENIHDNSMKAPMIQMETSGALCTEIDTGYYKNTNAQIAESKAIQITNQDAFVFGNYFIELVQLEKCICMLQEIKKNCKIMIGTGNPTLSDMEIEHNVELSINILKSFNLHFFERQKNGDEIYSRFSPKPRVNQEPFYCDMSCKPLVGRKENLYNNLLHIETNEYGYECMNTKANLQNEDAVYDRPRLLTDSLWNDRPETPSSHEYQSISSSYKGELNEKDLTDVENNCLLSTHQFDDGHGRENINKSVKKMHNLHEEVVKISSLEKEDAQSKVFQWITAFENDKLMIADKVSEIPIAGFEDDRLQDLTTSKGHHEKRNSRLSEKIWNAEEVGTSHIFRTCREHITKPIRALKCMFKKQH